MSENNVTPLNISAEPGDLKGRYANLCAITSQEREVIIDFINVININSNKQGNLVARVILNRFTAQELIDALKVNLEKWEKMRYENDKSNLIQK